MFLYLIFILHFQRSSIVSLSSILDRGTFIVSLEVEIQGENMKFATIIKYWIKDRLEPVFVPYTLNKRIENEIEYWLEMLSCHATTGNVVIFLNDTFAPI
jgi:hypothetical protein